MTDPRHRTLVDLRTLVERASSVGHLAGLLRQEPGWEDAGYAARSEAARRLSFSALAPGYGATLGGRTVSERLRIWSSGADFMTWEHNNCDRCLKRPSCDISNDISRAIVEDGTFSPATVTRLGYSGEPRFFCAERQIEVVSPKPAARVMAESGTARLPGFEADEPTVEYPS